MGKSITTNRKILEMLTIAPDTQLSERFRDKCKNFKGTEEDLLVLFQEIYNGCCEASDFTKSLVNPRFTSKYVEKH